MAKKKKRSKDLKRKELLRIVVRLQSDLQSAVWLIHEIDREIDTFGYKETLEETSFDMSESDDLR